MLLCDNNIFYFLGTRDIYFQYDINVHTLLFLFFRDDDNEHQVALINFERESAAKTATLLSKGKRRKEHILFLLCVCIRV